MAGRVAQRQSSRGCITGAKAGISGESISAFENGRPMRESNKTRVLEVFEAAGVDILNGDAPGARMRLRARNLPQRPQP